MRCLKSSMFFAVAVALAVSFAGMAQAEYLWVVSADLGTNTDVEARIYSGQGGLAATGNYWNDWYQMAGASRLPGRSVPLDSAQNATAVRASVFSHGNGADWVNLGGSNSLLNQDGVLSPGTLDQHTKVVITLGPDVQATDRFDVAAYIAIPGYATQTYTFGLGEYGATPDTTASATTVLNTGGATLVEGQNYVAFHNIAPIWADAGDVTPLPTYAGYYLTLTVFDDAASNAHFAGFQVAQVVPEPSAVALLSLGLAGMIAYAWRKRK